MFFEGFLYPHAKVVGNDKILTEKIWGDLVECVVVKPDTLTFEFKDNSKIEVAIQPSGLRAAAGPAKHGIRMRAYRLSAGHSGKSAEYALMHQFFHLK